MEHIENLITSLAEKYAMELERKFIDRAEEMRQDNLSHYLIYQVLGIDEK